MGIKPDRSWSSSSPSSSSSVHHRIHIHFHNNQTIIIRRVIIIVIVMTILIIIIIIIITIVTIVTIITKAVIITSSSCILFRPAVCPKIPESSNNVPPCERTASSSGRKKTTLGRLDWKMKFLHIQQKSGYVKSNHNLQHPVPPSNLPTRQR